MLLKKESSDKIMYSLNFCQADFLPLVHGYFKNRLKETDKQISNKDYLHKHDIHFSLFQI